MVAWCRLWVQVHVRSNLSWQYQSPQVENELQLILQFITKKTKQNFSKKKGTYHCNNGRVRMSAFLKMKRKKRGRKWIELIITATQLQGDPEGLGPGLGWLWFWIFHHSVGQKVATTEAHQPGELLKSSQQPKSETFSVTLYKLC